MIPDDLPDYEPDDAEDVFGIVCPTCQGECDDCPDCENTGWL